MTSRRKLAGTLSAALAFALLLLALPSFSEAKIVSFNNTDPDTWHVITYTEIQFKRPKISFEVLCPGGRANVAWLLVPSDLDAIYWDKENVNARCEVEGHVDGRPTCTAGIFEGETTTTTKKTTTTIAPTTTSSSITNRRREESSTTSAAASTTTKKTTTTTSEATTTTTFDNGLLECNAESGLEWIPSRAHYQAIGGCTVCDGEYFDLVTIKTHNMTHDGFYTLWLQSFGSSDDQGPRIVGVVHVRGEHGYLPADLFPLLSFFGTMGIVYLLTGLVWVALSACYYQDLLRLQFWIGAVIALGMLEMAVSYGDLEHLNSTGKRSHFLLVCAKLLFACKNTLARLLVLIVSMGFGIVKPRLGSAFKQIIAIGFSYFFFAAAYGVTHAIGQTETQASKTEMMVIIPLSVLDAAICWWIFLSLNHTMKTLSLRNNAVKLKLYSRFQYVLMTCVAATVVFAIWSIIDRYNNGNALNNPGTRDTDSIDWQNAWWQEGYWHLLFYVILLAIMYLWRPNNNNNRYAYTALETDNLDDEGGSPEIVPNYGVDAMKMRTLTSRGGASKDDIDEDLRWVEENIPSSTTTIATTSLTNDTAFPNFPMDSDEEVLHTKFEMSKME